MKMAMYSRNQTTSRRRHRRLPILPLALCFASPALSALTTQEPALLGHCPDKSLASLTSGNYLPICTTPKATGSSSSSPWTFAPRCARDMETNLEKYCVYTAGQFNDHAGTSFIVKPQTLGTPAALAELPRLDPRTEKYLGTTTGSNISKTNPDLKYITRPLPGKGIGTLATQAIRRGEIYMVSHPALIIDTELEKGPDPAIRERDRWALLETAFSQVGDQERATSLVGSTGGNKWEDIMRTNGFAVNIQGKMCSALFPEQAVSLPCTKQAMSSQLCS